MNGECCWSPGNIFAETHKLSNYVILILNRPLNNFGEPETKTLLLRLWENGKCFCLLNTHFSYTYLVNSMITFLISTNGTAPRVCRSFGNI